MHADVAKLLGQNALIDEIVFNNEDVKVAVGNGPLWGICI
jgi:hypothetical protein